MTTRLSFRPVAERFLYRWEFFGGLVHSRTDGERYELDHPHIAFLRALERGHRDHAIRAVREALDLDNTWMPDLVSLERAGVLERDVQMPVGAQSATLSEWLRTLYREAIGRTYLRAPINLSMYPLMACQLDCTFCYVTNEKWAKGSRRADEWERLLVEAVEMDVPFVSFLGGDPALFKSMPRLIRTCQRIGLKATITTNGTSLRADLVEALVESPVVTPVVSLQAMDDYHTEVTGRTFEEPARFINELHKRGATCNVNLVYINQTWDQLRTLIDWCAAKGVRKVTAAVFTNIKGVDLPVPSFTQYRRVHERVSAYVSERHPHLDFQTEGCQLYTAYPELNYVPQTHYERLTFGCDAGQARCEVMHDGRLLGCALLDLNRWAGANALDVGLQNAWDASESLRRLRTLRNEDPSCNSGSCPLADSVMEGVPPTTRLLMEA